MEVLNKIFKEFGIEKEMAYQTIEYLNRGELEKYGSLLDKYTTE